MGDDNANPLDALDDQPSEEHNPLDDLDGQSAATATAHRMAQAAQGGPEPQIPRKDATWSNVAGEVLPAIGARMENKAAGVQEYFGTDEYRDARKKLWQSMILPEAVRDAKKQDIALTDYPDVVDIAKHLGIRPDQFARDWPTYANMTDEERQQVQKDQRERIAEGSAQAEAGASRRRMASEVSELYQPQFKPYSPKQFAFETATMAPDLLVGAAATTAGGPAAGAAVMGATIAPEQYAAARNRGLNDRQASTYAMLTTVAMSVPELPVLKIIEDAPGARQALASVVGQKIAASTGGRVASAAVAQGVTQSFVQSLQEGIDSGLLDEDMSLPEALKRIGWAGLEGAAIGAGAAGTHAGAARLFQGKAPKAAPVETGSAAPGPSPETAEGAPDEVIAPEEPSRKPAGQNLVAPEQVPDSQDIGNADAAAVHQALQAIEAKTASPPQVELLEGEGLARRNEVNVPRLLPAGIRRLRELDANPPVTIGKEPGSIPDTGGIKPESQAEAPVSAPAVTAAAPEPGALEHRLSTDDTLRDSLEAMKGETGWAQVGGKLLMDADGKVLGRTSWIPREEWWRDRPKGLTEAQVHGAVDKALAGESLSKRQRDVVDFMVSVHDERTRRADIETELEHTVPDVDKQPAVGVDLTVLATRASEIDPEAAGKALDAWSDDDPATIARVQGEFERIIGGGRKYSETVETEGAGVAEPQGPERSAPRNLDLFGQDTRTAQEIADETRRRDQQRSPNRDVSADTGRPGDLFTRARQADLEDLTGRTRQPHELPEVPRHTADEHQGFHVGDIVTNGQGEHGKIRSIFKHGESDWTARVKHEDHSTTYTLPGELTHEPFTQDLIKARKETNRTPTEAQKKSGNYKKGTVSFGGIPIAIENPRGSTRRGMRSDGERWSRKMALDYGYVKGTEGKDGDEVDVFLTGRPDTGKVFVVNQVRPDSGAFDEHKVILGAKDAEEAKAAYLANYPNGWQGLGSLAEMTTLDFRKWVRSERAKRPLRPTERIERRTEAAQRKKVSEMTEEEAKKALLEHELTGIPNKRAYVDSDKLPVQVSIDADSLKWVNDHMGHESGNELLKAIASSLTSHSEHAFHLSGDEFALQTLHEREAHETMAKVAQHLKDAVIEVEMPDGKVVKLKGLGVSYGVGKDLNEADHALQAHKSRREAEGTRAKRGEAPPGAFVGAREEGREDQAGHAPERTEVKEDAASYGALHAAGGGPESGTAEPRGPVQQLDIFSTGNEPNQAPRKETRQLVRRLRDTHLVRTGEFRTGIDQVTDWRQAAHIFAPLRKEPQESMMALVTDEAGKPLSVIRHTIGHQAGADVVASILGGAIHRIPGARKAWFGHNHPSGNLLQSPQDMRLTTKMHDLLEGSGISPQGMIVVSPGAKHATFWDPRIHGDQDHYQERIPGARRSGSVPVEQRRFKRITTAREHGVSLNTPAAIAMYLQQGKHRNGVMLMDTILRPLSVIAMTPAEMRTLRTGEIGTGVSHLLQEIERSNASAAVPFGEDMAGVNNVGRFLTKGDVRVVEAVDVKGKGAHYGPRNGKVADLTNPYHSFRSQREEPVNSRDAPEFRRWFGQSKVVDERGEPLRVYHGTNQPVQKFDASRRGMMTQALSAKEGFFFTDHPGVASEYAEAAGRRQRSEAVAYERKTRQLKADVDRLEAQARKTGDWAPYEHALESWEAHEISTLRADEIEGQNLFPAHLKLENPLERDFASRTVTTGELAALLARARAEGHDGAILRNLVDSPKGTLSNQYVVFKPNQVRSAITLKAIGSAGRGLQRDQVHKIVRDAVRGGLFEGGRGFPHVEVHQDISTLPDNLRRDVEAAKAEKTASALYDPANDRIHLIAGNNATEQEVRENLWHEAVGHHGLRLVMDSQRYGQVMDGIYRSMPERVQATARRNGLDLTDPNQRRIAAEEVVAYAAGKILTGQELEKPLLPVWRRVYRAVRDFFGRMFGRPVYDEKTIAGLVHEARTAVGIDNPALRAGGPARSQRAPMFYSAVERAVADSKQGKASPDQWLATLKRQPGVKPEEIEWLDLEPWLKAHKGPVTREELANYLQANRLELEESRYGADGDHQLSEDEKEQTRLAEKLRAMGHTVGIGGDGALNEINVRIDPSLQEGGERYYHMHEPGDFDTLPEAIRPIALKLEEVSDRIMAARNADDWDHNFGQSSGTRYGEYTLPGGENYREMLLRLPGRSGDAIERGPLTAFRNRMHDKYGDGWVDKLDQSDTAEHQRLMALRNKAEAEGTRDFQSGHWQEPNILGHVRFKERTAPDGKKVLFLEEIQSDWHQRGRDEGYAKDASEIRRLESERDEAYAHHKETVDEVTELLAHHRPGAPHTPEITAARARMGENDRIYRRAESALTAATRAPPDAPFKTSWPMLIMKRMVRWAAEHGLDRIAWTTGTQQAERYGLETHVGQIMSWVNGDRYRLEVLDPEGSNVHTEPQATADMLRETLGNELAQRVIDRHGEPPAPDFITDPHNTLLGHTDPRLIQGLDLRVGDSGMRGFYDDILPRETGKLIKKYGGKVEQTRVAGAHAPEARLNEMAEQAMEANLRAQGLDSRAVRRIMVNWGQGGEEEARAIHPEAVERYKQEFEAAKTLPAHGFDITPKMREAALSEGFPLFARRQEEMDLPQRPEEGKYALVRRAVDAVVHNPVTNDFKRLINPVGMDQDSRRAAVVAREALGKLAHETLGAQENLERFSRTIEKLSPEEQLTMMDAIEHGVPQPNAALQPVADGIRQLLDHWRDEVRGLGTGALDNFIENYFPHYWQREDEARRVLASIMGRRPLRGPASFLKMRTIPTIKEGMDAGLKPLTINPLVMSLLKVREMQRFITGTNLMRHFKEEGLAKFVPAGSRVPDGWAPINDASAKVRQWSEEEQGFIDRGQYAMPEGAARVINNHLSGSALQNFAPTRIFRIGSNMLNSLQLGFSAFHLGFTTLDAIISKNALAFERAFRGDFGGAARAFGEAVTGPGAAGMNVARGYKLLQAYTDPAGATPELQRLVRALEQAGGRAHMDRYYLAAQGVSPFRGTGVRSLGSDIIKAARGEQPVRDVAGALKTFAHDFPVKIARDIQATAKTFPALEVPFELAGRVVRMSTSWIMEHLVPMQKLGVFSDLASDHLRAHPFESPEDRVKGMQKIWDSVDNRLGEMVYDNLFWNRTLKDSLHLGIRAVGWNVGTIREIAGAPVDTLGLVDKLIRTGKITAQDVGHRIPYVLAMTMTTAIYGSVLGYLFTGEWPQELKDYFFPRTGGVTTYGTPQRVSLPSYAKDVYEYSQRPGTTVLNKLNPMFNVLGDLWKNEDFFGNPIADPDASYLKQKEQQAAFVGRELQPFSLQGRQRLEGTEQPGLGGQVRKVLPYVGITPAPGYITSAEQIERRERLEMEKKYVSDLKYKLKKAAEAHDRDEVARLRTEYQEAARHMRENEARVKQDKGNAAKMRRQKAITMRQQGLPATADLVASLPLEPDEAARRFFAEQAQQEQVA